MTETTRFPPTPKILDREYANRVREALEQVVAATADARKNGVLVQFTFGQNGDNLVVTDFKAFTTLKLDN